MVLGANNSLSANSEKVEDFVALLRHEALEQMNRFDKDVLTVVTFQTHIHEALSLYF